MAVSKKTWYLWYFKVFPLLSALIVALLLWLCDLTNLFRIWMAITAYFFVYLKLPYRKFNGNTHNSCLFRICH